MGLTGWLARGERDAIAYLIAENRLVHQQLGGRRHGRLGHLRCDRARSDSRLRSVVSGDWPPDVTADRLLMLTASNREYVWWADAVSPAVLPEVRSASKGKQVTDRYLLGLARRNGGQLVTFDRQLAADGGHTARRVG